MSEKGPVYGWAEDRVRGGWPSHLKQVSPRAESFGRTNPSSSSRRGVLRDPAELARAERTPMTRRSPRSSSILWSPANGRVLPSLPGQDDGKRLAGNCTDHRGINWRFLPPGDITQVKRSYPAAQDAEIANVWSRSTAQWWTRMRHSARLRRPTASLLSRRASCRPWRAIDLNLISSPVCATDVAAEVSKLPRVQTVN